jgi:hypothetical protein
MKAILEDPGVRLVLATRFVLLIGAPITLLLVAALRPPEEQGFYFIFSNVQAIATLFEYGIGTMVVQFASHARASLGSTIGLDEAQRDRLTLATLAVVRTWFVIAASVVVVAIVPLGFVLFNTEAQRQNISYAIPWVALGVCLAVYLTIVPAICALEGNGKLVPVQRMRLTQAVATALCMWTLVPTAGSLSAVAAASAINLLVAGGWLLFAFPQYLDPRTGREFDGTRIDRRAFFSAQTRTAVTWIVAFLGPQLLAPIVFRYQGAAEAGKVGLSLAAANAPLMLSVSWLHARYPDYGALAAANRIRELDAVAKMSTIQASLVCLLGGGSMLIAVWLLRTFVPQLGERFLPLPGLAALTVTTFPQLWYQAMAARLRAHREESLLFAAVIGTAAMVLAAIAGARINPLSAVFAQAAASLAILLPLSALQFVSRRRTLNMLAQEPR